MSNHYYIQDVRNIAGNSMLWWEKNNSGYVCDIHQAKVFTKDGALRILRHGDHFKMWPKDYIDSKITHHIDSQVCNHAQAIMLAEGK